MAAPRIELDAIVRRHKLFGQRLAICACDVVAVRLMDHRPATSAAAETAAETEAGEDDARDPLADLAPGAGVDVLFEGALATSPLKPPPAATSGGARQGADGPARADDEEDSAPRQVLRCFFVRRGCSRACVGARSALRLPAPPSAALTCAASAAFACASTGWLGRCVLTGELRAPSACVVPGHARDPLPVRAARARA